MRREILKETQERTTLARNELKVSRRNGSGGSTPKEVQRKRFDIDGKHFEIKTAKNALRQIQRSPCREIQRGLCCCMITGCMDNRQVAKNRIHEKMLSDRRGEHFFNIMLMTDVEHRIICRLQKFHPGTQ